MSRSWKRKKTSSGYRVVSVQVFSFRVCRQTAAELGTKTSREAMAVLGTCCGLFLFFLFCGKLCPYAIIPSLASWVFSVSLLQKRRRHRVANYTLSLNVFKGCRLRMACMQSLIQPPPAWRLWNQLSAQHRSNRLTQTTLTCNPLCRQQ